MKKLVYLSMVVSLMLALFPAVASAHTEEDPWSVNLMAGQHMDVGDVLVWNDGDYLYVKYVITDLAWCITETHLQVATSSEDIPQKNGNPIPGKFEENDEHECVTEVLYKYDLAEKEWAVDDELYIAAHAAVFRLIDECYEVVWQIGDIEVVNTGTGWLQNYADEFNWGEPAGPITAGPSLAVEEPAYTDPFIVGTTPTSEFPYNSNYVRGYATDFDVQWSGDLPFSGKLTISWSPGQSATEKKVVSDGFPAATLTAAGTPSPGQGYFLDKYPLVQHSVDVDSLSLGTHTINFQHTQGDGTFWDWIRLEKPCEQWETAWGDGPGFPGKNWAMYFEYTVQEPPTPVCPSIVDASTNIELLGSPPLYVSVGALESDDYVRIWQEFLGPLAAPLAYDLDMDRSAKADGPPGYPLEIPAGEYVCSYYVHLDNVGPSSTVQQTGYVQFDTDVLGLIISGGNLGTFTGRDLMFAADDSIGYGGTTYPDDAGVNYWRGFDVNYGGNLDDAVFSGDRVDFTMWVVNAHDSFRVILPALP